MPLARSSSAAMLCISAFIDDVIFAHKQQRLLDVAVQLKRSAHVALGLGYRLCAVLPVAGQRTHGTTFRALKVTSQVAAPGAESAVYGCLVFVIIVAKYYYYRREL